MTKNHGSRRRWIISLIALVAVAAMGVGAWYAFGESRLEALITPAKSNLAKIEAKAQAGENALKQGVKSVTAAASGAPQWPGSQGARRLRSTIPATGALDDGTWR